MLTTPSATLNLRLEPAHNPAPMKATSAVDTIGPLSRGALRHDVATRLLAAIFHGDLPAGTRLVIQRLAQKLGVSSTPVREALLELEAIGIVQFLHNKGALVKPFGPKELHEIYHLRRILESEAARGACGKIDRAELDTLRGEIAALQAGRGGRWSEREMATDRQLHELIAADCGSARLADEIRRYNLLVQAGRDIVGNQRHAQEQAMRDHLAIIDALLDGDAERAAVAMASHIDSTAAVVESLMFTNRAKAAQAKVQ